MKAKVNNKKESAQNNFSTGNHKNIKLCGACKN